MSINIRGYRGQPFLAVTGDITTVLGIPLEPAAPSIPYYRMAFSDGTMLRGHIRRYQP
jgi:hypothetical protein